MDKFFKYEYRSLDEKPLQDWAVARGGENMELALWLYNLTGQKYLLELCRKLRDADAGLGQFLPHLPATPCP